jgi:hypothetical protein
METRSQIKALLSKYEFIFDFDQASLAWKSNKKSNGNGTYIYVCKNCKRESIIGKEFCKIHLKNINKQI